MDKNEIKQANRKALRRFIPIMAIAVIIGGVTGFLLGSFQPDMLTDGIKSAGKFFGTHLAPWLMVALAVIVPAVCVPLYQSARKLLSAWDGEDEDVSDTVDRKLSVAIWISSVSLVLSYFLIAASYSGGLESFDSEKRAVIFFIGIVAFVAIMIETILLQQKCVDAAKQTNPEKKASVFDMKFQKKWLEDCDEAEKITIGKCAYKAYTATNTVCAVLAIVLAVCALVFEIGFLPSLIVCLVWVVNLSVYCKEALRYSKAGNKIS